MTRNNVTRRSALRLLAAAGAAIAASPTAAFAEQYSASQETEAALADAQAQADEVEAQLDSISSQYEAAAAELSATMDQMDDVNAQISDAQSQIDDKNAEIEETEGEIEETEQEIAEKQEVLGRRMSDAYKSGTAGILDLILSATSFDELTSNIYYLDKFNESDEQMISEIKDLQIELEAQKVELEEAKAVLEDQKAELEVQMATLEDLKADQQEEMQTIQAKQAEVSSLLDGLNEEVADLLEQRDNEILAAKKEAERIAAEQAAASSSSSSSSTSTSTSRSTSTVTTVSTGSSSGSRSLSALINACYSTGSTGVGKCAAWVTTVFGRAGIGWWSGNACDMYWSWCTSSDQSALKPGMIIAVPSCAGSYAALIYGHVGIYIGNGTVYQNLSGVVGAESLSHWISSHGTIATARWGWLGGVALS